MADCGATGSVLDSAARRVAGSSAGAFSQLIGHAAAMHTQPNQPLAPPVQLASLQNSQISSMDHLTAGNNSNSVRVSQGGGVVPFHPSNMAAAPQFGSNNQAMMIRHQQELHHATYHQHPQQQFQQQQHVAFDLHQRQMQLQQIQIATQQQQHQKQLEFLRQQQMAKQQVNDVVVQPSIEKAVQGHDGLVEPAGIDRLSAAWHELSSTSDVADTAATATATVGHEGVPYAAGIDELAEAWKEAEAEYQTTMTDNDFIDSSNLADGYNVKESYVFRNNDSVQSTPSGGENWMEEGMRQFEAGNMKSAIRAFELELQSTNSDNAKAWRMLGRCHAENDMDRDAILCFEEAVDRDPYSTDALLALGVSYVNELNHTQALKNLKAWITHNTAFVGLELGDDLYGSASKNDADEAFTEVQRLLLNAFDFNSDSSCSADILEALGVVYNVSRDYDAAVDALRKACDLRPNDHQLWNKLGATLANSNQSKEALPAYHQALKVKPKYARAWLNMAISHSNLQHYDEAARCYLQTLSLNPDAQHCWSYLRIALSCLERWDLIPLAASHDLQRLKEHYDFVTYPDDSPATV